MRPMHWLDERRQDARFALRQLRAAPGFALVAVLTLALGIGANSAMFALADATLLQPLPFANADRLVMLSEYRPNLPAASVNPVEFLEWTERARTFDALAALVAGTRALVLPDGTSEQVDGQAVTTRFFEVLGVRPLAGRTFQAGDEPAAATVAIVGEGFWRDRFGADPAIVGRALTIDGQSVTVIGIVPMQFEAHAPFANGRTALWTLLSNPTARGPAQRYAHYLRVVGRLKPETTPGAAAGEMETIADAIARESPGTNRGHHVSVVPLRDALIGGELRVTALLLLGVVGFVLLLCCANVANLFLSRTAARARELAVRSALGAGRGRIVAQLLTESVVLATLGGAAGAAIGAAILGIAPSLIPAGLLPNAVTLAFNGRVVAFCAGAALIVAVLFGFAPAWQATSRSLLHVFGGRGTTAAGARFRGVIAGAEIAVAVLLLCGAGLLLRTLVMLDRVDPGHDTDEALTAFVNLPMTSPPQAMERFYADVEREIANLPGVNGVAWGAGLPLDGWWYNQSFEIVGEPSRAPADRDGANYQMVSASYFRTLGVPVRRGRDFNDRDTRDSPSVAIVNDAFVRLYLAGREPLGARIAVNAMAQPATAVVREIVGVVGHVKGEPAEVDPVPQIYVPIRQNSWSSATLIVRPEGGSAAALAPAVRAAVARVDGDRPLSRVRTLDEIARGATARWRFRAQLVAGFAALALVVALVGVFGVLAYSVQQRTREFGVRMALGARRGDILQLVFSGAARVVMTGSLAGLIAAALLTRSIATLLFAVEPLDPMTFAGTAVLIVLTATAATAGPAWRAARVDPVVTFRND